jgi:D-arabinose 5-phosphate isomerase GutQ
MSKITEAIYQSFKIEAECIKHQMEILDEKAVLKAIDVLSKVKGKIIVAGAGSCSVTSRKIVHTLSSLRLPAMYLSPTTAPHGSLGTLQKDDILILISKGGRSHELDAYITVCKAMGAYLISVTENIDSEMARQADLVLRFEVLRESDPGNIFATSSNMVILAIFDAISAGLWHKLGYELALFADIHPNGAVGEMLNSNSDKQK